MLPRNPASWGQCWLGLVLALGLHIGHPLPHSTAQSSGSFLGNTEDLTVHTTQRWLIFLNPMSCFCLFPKSLSEPAAFLKWANSA